MVHGPMSSSGPTGEYSRATCLWRVAHTTFSSEEKNANLQTIVRLTFRVLKVSPKLATPHMNLADPLLRSAARLCMRRLDPVQPATFHLGSRAHACRAARWLICRWDRLETT